MEKLDVGFPRSHTHKRHNPSDKKELALTSNRGRAPVMAKDSETFL
jgi:hypothetical protein